MAATTVNDLDNLSPLLSSLVATVLGPMVMGVMIEQFLLGIVCYQAITYFCYHFSSDAFFCRSIVIFPVVFTLFQSVLDFIVIFRRLIRDYSNYESLDLQDWVFWMEASLTAWVAFIAHILYVLRGCVVTKPLPVCMFLGVVALTALVSGITVTKVCFSLGRMSKLARLTIPATIGFTSLHAYLYPVSLVGVGVLIKQPHVT